MKKESKKASLGDIARLAGVSVSAVCLTLQKKPRVNPGTRDRILQIAKELGYIPDARLSSLMAQVRHAKSKELLPIAWLNTSHEKDSWHRYRFQSPYLEGARARALELGYTLDEVWCHKNGATTMRRLSEILYQRGIEGVIVTFPAKHLRLNWDHFASVSFGTTLMVPRLHRITTDLHFNLQLAIRSLSRLGFRRIGICLQHNVDVAAFSGVRSMARDLYLSSPIQERIPPLFHPPDWRRNFDPIKEQTAWIKRYKPEVIIAHDNRLERWLQEAGYRVPEDVSIVNLAVDDDVLDWAGIHTHRREIGATAVEWLVSLMRNHQFGVPNTPLNILIQGTWQPGRTLKVPPVAAKKLVIPRKSRAT